MFIGVICGTMCSHAFARRLVVFYLAREAMFYIYFPFISMTYVKQWYEFYILCVFYDYLYSTAIPTVHSTECTPSPDVFILC